jgi:hypothetical protein
MSVLVIGRGAQVVASVVHALHDLAFEAVGVTEDDEATARLRAGGITALVIGGGVNRRARQDRRDLLPCTREMGRGNAEHAETAESLFK